MIGYNYNRYCDNLARKKRRRFFISFLIGFIVTVAFVGSSIYLLFFSDWMKITIVKIDGLKTVDSGAIYSMVDSAKNEVFLNLIDLKPQSNILFFDNNKLRSNILTYLPVIEDVNIAKIFPHDLEINIKERTPVGTWCFISKCRYFDDSGVLWGEALRSSGSILLSIDDQRIDDKNPVLADKNFLESIKTAMGGLDNLGIKIKRIEIPDGKIGDFKVYTFSGYDLLFNIDSDISGQIEVFRIILDQKGKEFKPQYIDLRIDGRVYYK